MLTVVFSPGDLLHTIGQKGQEAGMFIRLAGITISNNKLICVSDNNNFRLQYFLLECYSLVPPLILLQINSDNSFLSLNSLNT